MSDLNAWNQPSKQTLVADTKKIYDQLIAAESAWSLFLASSKNFDEEAQNKLRTRTNQAGLGVVFDSLQAILLQHAVAILCRITDHHKKDRLTLTSLTNDACRMFKDTDSDHIKEIKESRKIVLSSDWLSEIRHFRNAYLSHNLRDGFNYIPPSYAPFPQFISDISRTLNSVLALLGEPPFDFEHVTDYCKEVSTRFWNTFDKGLD